MFHASTAARATALALLSIHIPAHADDAQSSLITVTGTRPDDPTTEQVLKTPGGVDIVGAAEFENRLAVSLRDALAFSPGVYTQPRFGQEIRLSIRGSGISRGFHMRGLTLLQDGIPINLADNNGDFQELDPQVFDRIEVYRGANALRYGSATLGGGINAITPTGRTAPRFEARIDGGAFDTLRAKLAAGFATDAGDAFLALTSDRSDGDRDHADRRALRLNGNAAIRLAPNVETRLYASLADIHQKLPGALSRAVALGDPAQANSAAIAGDQARDIVSLRLQSRTTVDLAAGRISFGGYYNAKQLYHPIFEVVDQKSDDRGVFVRADLAGTLVGMPVEALLGSMARFGTTDARQYVNRAGRRGVQTAETIQTARTIDTYGELRATPLAGFTLIAGVVHTDGERQVENRRVAARSGESSYRRSAPKLGVLFTAAADIAFYANYSRSVELPGLSELAQAQPTPGFVPLNPQRAWTAEIGTRGTAGIAAWDISLYRADIDGELLQFTVDANIPAATFNADRTRHQGIEAGLDLQVTPWTLLRQSWQYSDFRFRADRQFADNRLPVIPRLAYRAALRLGTDRLGVTPNVEWVPQGAWADYANTTRAPRYALLGLNAEARATDALTLFVDARNLTGRKAIGDISSVVRAVPNSAIYYPVERRALYWGIRSRL